MSGLILKMGRGRMGEGLRVREAELIKRASAGDRAAFDDLVRQHIKDTYRQLHRLVGNHEDAEDLTQDCFVKAYRSLRFYRGEGTFSAWLGRIAVHLARDHHRQRGRQLRTVALDRVEVEPAARQTEELTQRELIRHVGQAVDDLPSSLRAALVLRVLEGRDYEDVARATGMKRGTVRTQVMKARKRLMAALRPWLGGELR